MERKLSFASSYIVDSDPEFDSIKTRFVNDYSMEKEDPGSRKNDDLQHLFPNKKRLKTIKPQKA